MYIRLATQANSCYRILFYVGLSYDLGFCILALRFNYLFSNEDTLICDIFTKNKKNSQYATSKSMAWALIYLKIKLPIFNKMPKIDYFLKENSIITKNDVVLGKNHR
jgi:hypothetical protein